MLELGIEPRISGLAFRNFDYQSTRLIDDDKWTNTSW
jgi:hypothetical protein